MRLVDIDAIKLPKGFFESVDNVPKFYEWLNTLPTIDPVKHGKWMAIGNTGLAACECGYVTDRYSIYNYCPNCGSKNGGEG